MLLGGTAWFETDDEDVASLFGWRSPPANPSAAWRGLKFEPLRKQGHSKEGRDIPACRPGRPKVGLAMPDLRRFAPADRDNDPQVIIALAVTREGVPVRSWIFPGNTSDVATVTKIKDDLRGMRLGRTLFVGAGHRLVCMSSGMYSAANLSELSRGAGRYILATPIQRIKEIKDEVLPHPGRYADIAPNLRAKEVIIGDGERRRRYILCLNEDEADRQKWRRADVLKTLKAELPAMKKDHPKTACRLVASKRYGRYLSLNDNGRHLLDTLELGKLDGPGGSFRIQDSERGAGGRGWCSVPKTDSKAVRFESRNLFRGRTLSTIDDT